jgi:hypothetical protein
MIRIFSLIYRSPRFADSVFNSIYEHTLIEPGVVDFTFVANDPTPELLAHLDAKEYRYVLQLNRQRSVGELTGIGYAHPEYIHRVYRGWNRAIMEGEPDDTIVLVNSDHIFSPGWLPGLLDALEENGGRRIVTSQTVERPGKGFGGAWEHDFGDLANFRAAEFQQFAHRHRGDTLRPGGVYMPCAFHRWQAIEAGLYPEGNLRGKRWEQIRLCGDAAFFNRMAEKCLCEHVTTGDSIVYHFGEGEMRE